MATRLSSPADELIRLNGQRPAVHDSIGASAMGERVGSLGIQLRTLKGVPGNGDCSECSRAVMLRPPPVS
jgi:hypothetical protein